MHWREETTRLKTSAISLGFTKALDVNQYIKQQNTLHI